MTQGEYLARAANCVACHTVAGGQPFAGGLKMGTPLGAIYTTNITPDSETGIGGYSLADFTRAMREGVAKDGHHLYPAMPYPSYAKLSDADIAALYDYFAKTVKPVRQANFKNEIVWPLNMRWPLAIWNAVFAPGPGYKDKPDHDAAWNRGAYLVQGAGHCGACHTPRGLAWNEEALDEGGKSFLAGADLDFWSAVDLTQDMNVGLGRWSQAEIAAFLKTGHNSFGAAYGSMNEVINNSTQYLTDADAAAMAAYLKSLPAYGRDKDTAWSYSDATTALLKGDHAGQAGPILYLQQCAACHVDDGNGRGMTMPPLAGNPTVMDEDPASLINIVLNGSLRLVVSGDPDPYRMPQYRVQMSDEQVADLVTFIRNGWGNTAPPVTAEKVAEIRRRTDPASDQPVILRMR
jgi:mono/diheme cytochrome c family protein